MEQKLTPKQKKVLELIYNTIKSEGFSPSFDDLKQELNVSSNQVILNVLKNLEKEGYIRRKEGQARSIQILPMGFKAIGKQFLIPLLGDTSAGPFMKVSVISENFKKFPAIPC